MSLTMSKDLELISYKSMNDEDIVAVARDDNPFATEYLISKYQSLVRGKARLYFLIGAEREDVIQEGLIGLYKAIQDYDKDKLTSFRGFAEICVTRQIITAIKTATRQKHIPLNSYVSFNKPMYDEGSDSTLLDVYAGERVMTPEEVVITKEELETMEKKTQELLSDLELEVLMLYIEGMTYQEIANKLDRHIKSIDNALQRVKRKLDEYLSCK